MKTLLIVPAYNEAQNIEAVVTQIEKHGYDYIVINDGSTDETAQVCKDNNYNVLNLSLNLGIGGAVQAGHKYAQQHDYDIDIQFDGDGQHDIHSIKKLEQRIEAGADLVIGSRFLEESSGFKSTPLRRVGITWLSFLIKLFTRKSISDPTSGFRASNKKAIALFSRDYPTDYPEPESIVLALKDKLSVDETAVKMHERQGGKSSIGGLSSLYYMIKVSLAIFIYSIAKKG